MKKFFVIFILIFVVFSPLFARNPKSISLGIPVRYASDKRINFGVNLDFKINHFALDIDVGFENRLERLNTALFLGFLPYYNNYLGENEHSITTQIMFGADFEFNFRSFSSYYAVSPLARLTFGWTTPIGLEFRVTGDIGAKVILTENINSFHYKVGLVVAYSFDIGHKPYHYKPLRYYQYED